MSFIEEDGYDITPLSDDEPTSELQSDIDDIPAVPAVAPLGIKEFQADFGTGTIQLSSGLSLTRRPDAVSFDYLTAFTLGPVAQGDNSEGAATYVWRVRQVGASFVVARQNIAGTGYDAETTLFDYEGDAASEIDIAFDQSARANICAERNGEVWLYWYDPIAADFVYVNLGAGFTPRILLDVPQDTTIADVVLFFVNRVEGKIQYRLQRDRYLIVYDTPLVFDPTSAFDIYLEDVARTNDYRLVVIYSIRNRTTGKYSLGRIESTLFPTYTAVESLTAGLDVEDGELVDIVLAVYPEGYVLETGDGEDDGWSEVDEFLAAFDLVSGLLGLAIPLFVDNIESTEPDITHYIDIDDFTAALALVSGYLGLPLITDTLNDEDELKAAFLTLNTSTLIAIVIQDTLNDEDELKAGWVIQSGTLAVP